MSLPIRTVPDDIDAVCRYLIKKPIGATLSEAKAVLDKKRLDPRKLTALKFWGLIEDHEGRMRITEDGRLCAKQDGAHRSKALQLVVRRIPAYRGVVERVTHRNEEALTAADVARHWYDHFRSDVSDSEKILNDQAVCFFQIAQAADLGKLIIGRKGKPTRFDFALDIARAFCDESPLELNSDDSIGEVIEADEPGPDVGDGMIDHRESVPASNSSNHVFITHGKNQKILEQVKTLVKFGRFEPVIAAEHETSAKPVPKKVMGRHEKVSSGCYPR